MAGRAFSLRDSDFAVDTQSTPATSVNAEVVFVGYGISAPAKGLDEYAGIDVKGKIVLVLKGSPSAAADQRPPMGTRRRAAAPRPAPAVDWTDETTDQKKAMTAYEKGAAAILLYTPPAGGGGMFGGAAAAPAAAQAQIDGRDAPDGRRIALQEAVPLRLEHRRPRVPRRDVA